ncbi:hypothetical protein DPMN_069234 [Dreissena polymorpha]|uniref:Uncharacterized protein n=1 Tax=Dreissena polymorpha TaxID=45954 RepID=A0A9D3YYQ4_DREPO|nr:hypothetical protein DPMN_069234 [Dreissena polymorpha]
MTTFNDVITTSPHVFWSHIVGSAKVGLCDFEQAVPEEMFADYYLTELQQRDEKLEHKSTRAQHQTSGRKPPYTYAMMMAAAIYASGERTATMKDIIRQLRSWFADTWEISHIAMRKKLAKPRVSSLFYKQTEKARPVKIGVDAEQWMKYLLLRNDYADRLRDLQDELELPNLMDDLAKGRCKPEDVNSGSGLCSGNRSIDIKSAAPNRKRLPMDDMSQPCKRPRLSLPARPSAFVDRDLLHETLYIDGLSEYDFRFDDFDL